MIAQGVAVAESDAKIFSYCCMLYILELPWEQKCGRYLLLPMSGSTPQEEKNSLAEITHSNKVLIDDI